MGGDEENIDIIKNSKYSWALKLLNNAPTYIVPSNKWAIEMASKIPYASVAELIDNAEKIKEYCKQTL